MSPVVPPMNELLQTDLLESGIETSGKPPAGGKVESHERGHLDLRELETGGDPLAQHRLPFRLEPAAKILVGRQPPDHQLHASLRHRSVLRTLPYFTTRA